MLGLLKSDEKMCSGHVAESEKFNSARLLKLYQEQSPDVLDRATATRLNDCVRKYPNASANKLVSKYVVHQKRVNNASQAYLTELVAIDSVLGAAGKPASPKLEEICSKSPSQEILKSCDFLLKKCKEPANLQSLVQQTQDGMQSLSSLTADLSQLQTKVASSSGDEQRSLKVKMGLIQIQIDSLERGIPWVQGQKFKDVFKKRKNVQEALIAQLQENRSKIGSRFDRLQEVGRCLRGHDGDHCEPNELRKDIEEAPPLPNVSIDWKDSGRLQERLAISRYQNYQECILERKADQDRTTAVISSAVQSAVYSLLTLGAGSWLVFSKGAMLAKDLVRLAMVTSQSDLFVTEGEKLVKECLHQSYGLEKVAKTEGPALTCPQPNQNTTKALQYNACLQQGVMTVLAGLPLAQMKITPTVPPDTWKPKSEHELKKYFGVHVKEVNENAAKLTTSNSKYFSDVAQNNLKTLRKHDLEKFLSFKTLSKDFGYQGVPKEIIQGLKNSDEYMSLLSKDGKNVELSISKTLQILWGESPESLAIKISTAKTAAEKTHWESVLKLRDYLVQTMDVIDGKIMHAVYANVKSADERVELKLIEMLADQAARISNPVTKSELGRPVLSVSNYINKEGGHEWFVKKISEANNPAEREAAIKLINRIGMPELQRMSTELEKTYRGSGLSGQLRYSILVMMFSQRTMDGQ